MDATLVQLIDGQLVQSDASEWRHETLARQVLTWPLEDRRAWLDRFEKLHGTEDAEQLKDKMAELHAKARAA